MGKLQYTKLKRRIRIFCILMSVGILLVKASVINHVYAAETDGNTEYTANQVTVVCPGVGSVDDVVTEWFVPFNLKPDVKEFDESYYNQLDDDSRSVYDELYGIYKDRADSEQYSLTCINNRTFMNTNADDKARSELRNIITPAMIALVYDHPEISWITNVRYSWSYSYSIKNKSEDGLTVDLTVSNVKFNLSYTNVGTKDEMDTAVNSAKEEIDKADISTQYNKVKAIHDYLVANISYNYCAAGGTIGGIKKEYDNIQSNAYQTAYSAFYTCNNDDTDFGSGIYTVCAGYARGFKVLCDAYDIPCVYVTGTAISSSGGGGHAWNYVQIAENWYAVDCTWDDQESKTYYDFFLTGGLEIPSSFKNIPFNKSHIASGKWNSNQDIEFIYPALSDKKYCEYLDNDKDGVCDSCRRIIDPGLSISLEGWTYGSTPKTPVVKAARVPDLKESDMDEKYGYTVWYKKKDEADSEYSQVVPTEAGDYTVQVALPVRNDADFDYPTTKATAEFTILKAERHLEFGGYKGIYDGMSHDAVLLPDDVPDGLVLQYSMDDGDTWINVMPEVKNVADSGRKIRIKASKDNNYFEQNAEVTIQIQKKPIVITPDSGQSKEFGKEDPVLNYTIAAGSLAGEDTEDVIAGALGREEGEGRGIYKINKGTLTADNYDITVIPDITFEIQKASPSIRISGAKGKVYDGKTLEAPAINGVEEEALITYSYCKTESEMYLEGLPKDAGEWYIVAHTEETENYKGAVSEVVRIGIAPAKLIISNAVVENKVYDGNKKAVVTEISFSGYIEGEEKLSADEYFAYGEFADENSGADKQVMVEVTLRDEVANYVLYDTAYNAIASIQKADIPAVVPEKKMDVTYSCNKVGDVSLPDNWIWENTEKELQEGEVVSAFAVYNGEDKGNYVIETIEVKIRRQSCSHPHKETRGAVPATVEQAGYTGDEYCTICNIMLAKGEVIPKLEEPSKPVDTEKPEEPLKPADVVNHQKTQKPLGTILTDEAYNAKVKVTNSGRLENGEVNGAEVQYTKPSKSASKVTIPATVNIDGVTYKVTSIAVNAFKNDKKLTKVTIGGNVKTIGTNAFSGCKKITRVTIPEKVTKIGTNAFCGCKKLKTITIKSAKLKNIGKNAFKGIHKKAVFKVPGKMLSKYKKKFTSKTGFRKTMKVKKK